MAHQISFANGKAEMAYAGDTPWHGLGTKVDGLQTVEAMLRAASLTWTVSTRPLFTEFAEGDGPNFYVGQALSVKGYRAIVRDDTKSVLGVASDRYQPIQNTEAGDIATALIGEGATVEVAGALGDGERCWMLSHIPGDFDVVDGDRVKTYFLLAWGHDGKHGVAGLLTPVRVVCNNTLRAALGDKWKDNADVFIRHYGKRVDLNIAAAREALGLVSQQAAETANAYRCLAARDMSELETRRYIADVFPYPSDVVKALDDQRAEEGRAVVAELLGYSGRDIADALMAAKVRVDDTRDIVLELLEGGKGADIPGVRGTAWGAYNAVTEYVDHAHTVLASGKVSTVRQQSALFGAGATLKRQALDKALALV